MSTVTPIRPPAGGSLRERIEAEDNRLCQIIGMVNTVRLALDENGQAEVDGNTACQLQYTLEVVNELLNGVLARMEGMAKAASG